MVSPSITKRQVRADFLTTSYRCVGEAQVGRMSFTGLLNDDSAMIEIYNVTMARAHQPTKLVDCFETLTLVKNDILAVCLKRVEDVGQHILGRGGYSTTDHPVFLTNSVYEILWTLRWSGHFDFSALMADGARVFFPIYDAKLTHILVPATIMECPAIFLNRRFVASLALIKERQKWE